MFIDFSDYRFTEICPKCGAQMKHDPSYKEECFGYTEVEYGLTCPNCGLIDYYSYGSWEGNYDEEDEE